MRLLNNSFLLSVLYLTISYSPLMTTASPVGGVWDTIPSPKPGNCDGYDVNTMVSDAKTLAQNAISAIEKMLNDKLAKSDLTLLNTAFTSWGIEYKNGGLFNWGSVSITSGQDTLSTALGNYQSVLSILDGSTKTRARLMCTDAGWKYVTTLGDTGQTPKDDPLPGITPNQPGFSFNDYYTVMVPDIEYDSSGKWGSEICTPHNLQGQELVRPDAITWWQANLIMVCAGAFNGKKLSDRIAAQSSLPVGAKLDDQQVSGAVFLHEMMHFLGKNIIDVVVDLGGGSKSKAYGFDGALHMALNPAYAGKAVFNADNYRNFAMAVTLNAIDWSEDGTKKS